MNEIRKLIATPSIIIFPKSITGLMPLNISAPKPTIVVRAVYRQGMIISEKAEL